MPYEDILGKPDFTDVADPRELADPHFTDNSLESIEGKISYLEGEIKRLRHEFPSGARQAEEQIAELRERQGWYRTQREFLVAEAAKTTKPSRAEDGWLHPTVSGHARALEIFNEVERLPDLGQRLFLVRAKLLREGWIDHAVFNAVQVVPPIPPSAARAKRLEDALKLTRASLLELCEDWREAMYLYNTKTAYALLGWGKLQGWLDLLRKHQLLDGGAGRKVVEGAKARYEKAEQQIAKKLEREKGEKKS